MLIGVVSDTHIPASARRIPDEALRAFEGADMILHCGDLTSWDVVEALEQIAPVTAVRGNTDGPDVASRLEKEIVIPVGRFRIGVTHGKGKPGDLPMRVFQQFCGVNVDAIIFGHSHQPMSSWVNGVLMFNPGSPTQARPSFSRSVGVLRVEEDIRADIVPMP